MNEKISIEVKITDKITFALIPSQILLEIMFITHLWQKLIINNKIPKKDIGNMTLNEIQETLLK